MAQQPSWSRFRLFEKHSLNSRLQSMVSVRLLAFTALLPLVASNRLSNRALVADASNVSQASELTGTGCYCQSCSTKKTISCSTKIVNCYPDLLEATHVFYDYTSKGGHASLQFGLTPLDAQTCKDACDKDGFENYCSKTEAGRSGNYHWSTGFDCWAVSDGTKLDHQSQGVVEAAADPCFFTY
uniref:Uncharacterized protein n=1 Tax=Alexandrium andersonii TaxID=327968 RepID=A0A7S2GHK1_9DINO